MATYDYDSERAAWLFLDWALWQAQDTRRKMASMLTDRNGVDGATVRGFADDVASRCADLAAAGVMASAVGRDGFSLADFVKAAGVPEDVKGFAHSAWEAEAELQSAMRAVFGDVG